MTIIKKKLASRPELANTSQSSPLTQLEKPTVAQEAAATRRSGSNGSITTVYTLSTLFRKTPKVDIPSSPPFSVITQRNTVISQSFLDLCRRPKRSKLSDKHKKGLHAKMRQDLSFARVNLSDWTLASGSQLLESSSINRYTFSISWVRPSPELPN